MNVARSADGLLSASQTVSLLEMLSTASLGATHAQIARDMAVRRAASHARTYNSIMLLRAAGLLECDSDRVRVTLGGSCDWRSRIADWVARQMADRMAKAGAHALRILDGEIVIDPMQLPGPVDGLRLWLIEFGIASRTGSSSRRWVVEPHYASFFLEAARLWNKGARRRISQAMLQLQLEDQSANGDLAEEWVLRIERARLTAHPLLEQVKRVSIEDVAAGFDIISFSTSASLVHDRFLEIKSFAGKRRFFWSRNEIEVARKLGEAYFLYIVDRDRLDDDGYAPEVISGPYAALIETANNGWSISPTTFECIAIES